eukprot:scaffold743_cov177-Ochromonas_danica.AAC.14
MVCDGMCERTGASMDVWGVGCVLAELLLGRVFFADCDDVDQIKRILRVEDEVDVQDSSLIETWLSILSQSNCICLDLNTNKEEDTDLILKKREQLASFLGHTLAVDYTRRSSAQSLLAHALLLGNASEM